jgi:hypothetical protein
MRIAWWNGARSRAALPIGAALLAACAGHVAPAGMPPVPFAWPHPTSCYVTPGTPKVVRATVTFYGWPDNTPPGNAIAHPVIHEHAGGDGTYCNPTTFATEPSNDVRIPYGIKIYVPYLKQYFVREDDCTPSGPPVGSGSNGCYKLWFDLWIGGDAKSNISALVHCETSMTKSAKVPVILNPRAGLPVAHAGPIYRDAPPPNGTCYGHPGHPRQSTRKTILPN